MFSLENPYFFFTFVEKVWFIRIKFVTSLTGFIKVGEEGGMPLIWIRKAEYKIEANYYHTVTGLKCMLGNPPSPLTGLFQAGKWGLGGGWGAVGVRIVWCYLITLSINFGFILCLQLV